MRYSWNNVNGIISNHVSVFKQNLVYFFEKKWILKDSKKFHSRYMVRDSQNKWRENYHDAK